MTPVRKLGAISPVRSISVDIGGKSTAVSIPPASLRKSRHREKDFNPAVSHGLLEATARSDAFRKFHKHTVQEPVVIITMRFFLQLDTRLGPPLRTTVPEAQSLFYTKYQCVCGSFELHIFTRFELNLSSQVDGDTD